MEPTLHMRIRYIQTGLRELQIHPIAYTGHDMSLSCVYRVREEWDLSAPE